MPDERIYLWLDDSYQSLTASDESADVSADAVQRHIRRYRDAAETIGMASGSYRVLDVGCGSGYGVRVFQSQCPNANISYVGIDSDRDAIEFAMEHHGIYSDVSNAHFFCVDAMEYDPSILFDRVICVEMIEHLPREQQRPFVEQLSTLVTRTGSVYLTCPLLGGVSKNPHHHYEPSLGEIVEWAGEFFNSIHITKSRVVTTLGTEQEMGGILCQQVIQAYTV